MKHYFKNYFRNFDYGLLFVYILLMLFGLVMIYSASIWVSIVHFEKDPDHYYKRQLLNICMAFCLFLVAVVFPYKRFADKKILGILFAIMIFLEVALILVGNEVNGARSWIDFGVMNFQPSEFAKLFIIIYFSGTFYRKSIHKGSMQLLSFEDVTPPLGIWLFIVLVVGFETDLGALGIIVCIAMSVVIASGVKGKTLQKIFGLLSALGVIGAIGILIFKWDTVFNSSRRGRITSYLDPFSDPLDTGYHVINGYYAIGAGGLEGRGLGQSIQKLGYVPEPQTDFIMAIIAEELGIVGVSIVIFGLGFIVMRGLYVAMKTKDPLARMLAAGISTWIGIQTFINLGGLSGLIPLTGVTLPFISYGGTSILLLSVAMGILINVSTHYKLEKRK
ncbi:FtsW/RodA/SpoVE family cell cycle protein [Solibacillus sp. MA9]|uniref:Probable peptidoglycan glycosyltransferase FtsW n=1 Tax=Solibacillus palustris TaxID=2908203 RepID=A0ABS9U9T3_9BACL|nr:FtsW/RodA/SpoVE family cell cycle protein [Solibacillus sp. MA9]MCH7320800.1 FtsW/RodA/SpoVE family cell cycle protein [Solibacillus sp. MA9]